MLCVIRINTVVLTVYTNALTLNYDNQRCFYKLLITFGKEGLAGSRNSLILFGETYKTYFN